MINSSKSICPKVVDNSNITIALKELSGTKYGHKKKVDIKRFRAANAILYIGNCPILYFLTNNMKRTLLSALSKVLLPVRRWDLRITLVR